MLSLNIQHIQDLKYNITVVSSLPEGTAITIYSKRYPSGSNPDDYDFTQYSAGSLDSNGEFNPHGGEVVYGDSLRGMVQEMYAETATEISEPVKFVIGQDNTLLLVGVGAGALIAGLIVWKFFL